MITYGNLPLNVPTLRVYRGSPLPLYLYFPPGYLMPALTARALTEAGALLAVGSQPAVDVLGQLAAVSFTQAQVADLPDYVRVVIAFDGVDKLATRLELSTGVAPFPQGQVLNYEGADIRLNIYDLESVNLARQYMLLAQQALETSLSAKQAYLLSGFTDISLANLRALDFNPTDQAATAAPVYFVIELSALFKYSPYETATDNGTTVLQDANGNRWVKTTLSDDIYNPNR